MGIFQTMVKVRNLAPEPRNVRFDGQELSIPVGESLLPAICVKHAMEQNPIMGTADPDNPSIWGGTFLIVPIDSQWDREPLTEEEWLTHLGRPCRMNEVEFFEGILGPKERIAIKGKGKRTQAKSLFDTGVKQNVDAESLTGKD